MWRTLVVLVVMVLLSSLAHAQPRRIAVLDFANSTKDPALEWLGPSVAETITTKLNGVRSLQLVERVLLYKVLQEQKFNLSDLVDPSQAIQIGKLLGAEQVVLGGYTAFGGRVRFTARFVDTATGAILTTSQIDGVIDRANPGGLFAAFDQLAQATIDSLNTRVAIVQGSPQPVPVTADKRIVPTPAEQVRIARALTKSLEAQEGYGRGLVAFRKSALVEATREFERATALDPGYAKAWQDRGRVLELLGRWPEALKAQEAAYQLLARAGDEPGQAVSLRWIGNVHFRQGRYAEALNYYERSLRLAEKLEDSAELAGALGSIGIMHYTQGRYEEALSHLERSLRLAEKLGDEHLQEKALQSIGNIQAMQGSDAEALNYYERSLRLAEKLGDRSDETLVLRSIGIVHARQNRDVEALRYYERSLRLADQLGAESQQAWTLFAIGLVHAKQERYRDALNYYDRALIIANRLGMAQRDQYRQERDRVRSLVR